MFVYTSNRGSQGYKEKIEKETIEFFNKNQAKIINGKGFEISLEKFLDETIRKDVEHQRDKMTAILVGIGLLLALLGGLFFFFLRAS